MKKKKRVFFTGVVIIVSSTLLYWMSLSYRSVVGKYVLEVDGRCHFLPFDSDTLLLNNDGVVLSKNFTGDAKYEVKNNLLEKYIDITSNFGKEGMTMRVEHSLFDETKIVICVNGDTFYSKIE